MFTKTYRFVYDIRPVSEICSLIGSAWRGGVLKKLSITLVCLQAADGFLTMWATNNGFREANPLAAPIAQTWLFPTWKISVSLLGIAILAPLARRLPNAVKRGLGVASLVMVAVLVANGFTLLDAYTMN